MACDFLKKYSLLSGFVQTSFSTVSHGFPTRCLFAGRIIASTAASCPMLVGFICLSILPCPFTWNNRSVKSSSSNSCHSGSEFINLSKCCSFLTPSYSETFRKSNLNMPFSSAVWYSIAQRFRSASNGTSCMYTPVLCLSIFPSSSRLALTCLNSERAFSLSAKSMSMSGIVLL